MLTLLGRPQTRWSRTLPSLRTGTLGTALRSFAELQQLLGDRFTESRGMIEQHAAYESHHKPTPPIAVAFPKTNEEVAAIVNYCGKTSTAIVPWGAGTSLEGHLMALEKAVCIDLSQMDQILEVNAEDMDCRVQAGVTREALNEYIRDTGLNFPVDPGANASLGGMAATRASGTNAVRYGTMREVVLGLTVVTADGKIVRTGGRARKSSAGYDLTRLFIGSEGTLGIITEVQLRLFGIPEHSAVCTATFSDLASAVNTVILVAQMGIPVGKMELLDAMSITAVNKHSHMSLPVAPTLFFEFQGSASSVEEQSQSVVDIAKDFGALGVHQSQDLDERRRLWKARHHLYWSVLAEKPGSKGLITDVCVPVSKLADCILETQDDMEKEGVASPILGHVGDGNFHVIFPIREDDPKSYIDKVEKVYQRMGERAIRMGGTCTGEHGVGIGKMDLLVQEHGKDSIDLMKSIKAALDPQNLLNPGKILYGSLSP